MWRKKEIVKYEEAFDALGLKGLESYEITINVLGALDKETINDTKNEIIKKNTPFYLRGIMKDFSGVKDTNIYKTLKNGRTRYYFKVFQKI